MDVRFCFPLPDSYYVAEVHHLVLWDGDGHVLAVEFEVQSDHILGRGSLVLCFSQFQMEESCL